MTSDIRKLVKRLGVQFSRPELLEQALTHRSAATHHNERLEFLGDAVLSLVAADELFRRFPDATEGELSRLRVQLVRRETLAAVARELALGDFLRLGSGELKSGGFRRESILADALESIIGAAYLEGGLDCAAALVRRLLAARLLSLPEFGALKDPKTRLQEFLQSRQRQLPEYRVVQVTGQAHAQTFVVECHVAGLAEPARGSGSSRRRAEQASAVGALERLAGE